MSNDVDPHRPGDQPQPVNEVISGGAPMHRQGTTGVDAGDAAAATGSFDEVDSRSPQAEPPVWQAPLVAVRTGELPPTVTVADPVTITATPLTSSPVPPVAGVTPLLDGTFSVEYDWSKQTVNGKRTVGDMSSSVDWWALRSLCTSAGCVATGAQLAQENHQAPVGGGMVLRFVDGHWAQTPHLGPGQGCPGGTNPQIATSETFVWSLEPQPDGTLRGIQTDTAMSDERGNRGYVYRTPLLVTRKGDVPTAVVLADPSLFELPSEPPSTSPHP